MLLMYVAGGTADCFSGSQSAHLCINSSTTVSNILTERQVYSNTTVFQTSGRVYQTSKRIGMKGELTCQGSSSSDRSWRKSGLSIDEGLDINVYQMKNS